MYASLSVVVSNKGQMCGLAYYETATPNLTWQDFRELRDKGPIRTYAPSAVLAT